MPTSEEIEQLKASWRRDPTWDIETTEGFEQHFDELLAFGEQARQEWAKAAAGETQRALEAQPAYWLKQLLFEVRALNANLERVASAVEVLTIVKM